MPSSSPLFQAYFEHPSGLCGQHDPAKVLTKIADTEKRLRILAFMSLLKVLDHDKLLIYQDHWVFDPAQVAYKRSQEVNAALRVLGLQMPKTVSRVWWQISRGIQGRFQGSFRSLLKEQDDDVLKIQQYLRESKITFPVISAPVTSAFWLDAVHRIGCVDLDGWVQLRVSLGKREIESAAALNIVNEGLHPALVIALRAWKGACRSLDDCGLRNCPKKK